MRQISADLGWRSLLVKLGTIFNRDEANGHGCDSVTLAKLDEFGLMNLSF
jgi:hypothetical protein